MENCIADAGVEIADVDAVNMHGTSTPLGDVAETKALKKVFGEHLTLAPIQVKWNSCRSYPFFVLSFFLRPVILRKLLMMYPFTKVQW